MLDFERVIEAFASRGKLGNVREYEEAYRELTKRKELICKASPKGVWGAPNRIQEYSLVLRQVQLHRAISLYEGSFATLISNSVYSMTLAIRGYYETVAVLGYMHKRLYSWSQGLIDGKAIDDDICTLFLGGRNGGIKMAPEAKQILSMLDEADKTISRHILGGKTDQYDMLTDCYKYLCEFSHPNFHSNSVSFDLDKEGKQYIIRHDQPMKDIEFNLIQYLLLATPLFIELYDRIGLICKEQ